MEEVDDRKRNTQTQQRAFDRDSIDANDIVVRRIHSTISSSSTVASNLTLDSWLY